MTIYVLGIEPFKMARIFGIHTSKKAAIKHASHLEKNKNSLCCQKYEALTQTEVNKRKLELYV